jgi:hypothetical protein
LLLVDCWPSPLRTASPIRTINAVHEPVFGSSDGQFPASPRPNDRRRGGHVPIAKVVFDWLHIAQQRPRTRIQRQDTVGVQVLPRVQRQRWLSYQGILRSSKTNGTVTGSQRRVPGHGALVFASVYAPSSRPSDGAEPCGHLRQYPRRRSPPHAVGQRAAARQFHRHRGRRHRQRRMLHRSSFSQLTQDIELS